MLASYLWTVRPRIEKIKSSKRDTGRRGGLQDPHPTEPFGLALRLHNPSSPEHSKRLEALDFGGTFVS